MQRVRKEIGCDWKDASKYNYSGKGVTVAILDTGIGGHPDFLDRVVSFQDFINYKREAYDDSGHGTHVAGCLAGSGLLSQGRLRGVAPGCNLVIGKILDHKGGGNANTMLTALRWIQENKASLGIKILNISIGFEDKVDSEKIRQLLEQLEELNRSGILVVVAAGNKGPGAGSISALGMGRSVLTVGCHDGNYDGSRERLCSSYSGRGPSRAVMKKPDLVAPGTHIFAASAKCRRYNKGYFFSYEPKSGTSFAAPLVAGAAALLLEKDPTASPGELMRRLCYTARDLSLPWGVQGWGMLNIQAAMEI